MKTTIKSVLILALSVVTFFSCSSDDDDSLDSVVPNAPEAPISPTIGTATVGNTQATVSFTAPSNDGGSAITSYTATSIPDGLTGTVNQAGSGVITITGLTNGTEYTFTVTATNAIGTSAASAASNSVVPTTVPISPTIGTAVAGISQATVSFTAPSNDGGSAITSYTATSIPDGLTGTVNQAGSGTITVLGLTNGTAYTFTVTATNATGTSAASEASNSVAPGPTVGDYYQGGVVFYIYSQESFDLEYVPGEIHGLIAAVEDQGSGISWYSALGLASAYNGGGYSDWFWPSHIDLGKMYQQKETINTTALANNGSNFANAVYLSSSQVRFNYVWLQRFDTGFRYGNAAGVTGYVRVIRAF
jgi:hypothetical protein